MGDMIDTHVVESAIKTSKLVRDASNKLCEREGDREGVEETASLFHESSGCGEVHREEVELSRS